MTMKKYCFGIDIGGTTIKQGLFSIDGELLEKWGIPTNKSDNGKYILEELAESLKNKMEERKIAVVIFTDIMKYRKNGS